MNPKEIVRRLNGDNATLYGKDLSLDSKTKRNI